MPKAVLTRHVLAFAEKLGVSEGMAVLDVGATCGHALGILQERYRHRLHAVGIDGDKVSVRHARRSVKGTFCAGDVRKLSGVPRGGLRATVMQAALRLCPRDGCRKSLPMGHGRVLGAVRLQPRDRSRPRHCQAGFLAAGRGSVLRRRRQRARRAVGL